MWFDGVLLNEREREPVGEVETLESFFEPSFDLREPILNGILSFDGEVGDPAQELNGECAWCT